MILAHLVAGGVLLCAPGDRGATYTITPVFPCCDPSVYVGADQSLRVAAALCANDGGGSCWPLMIDVVIDGDSTHYLIGYACGADIDADQDCGTDADIAAFFAACASSCSGPDCMIADFDGDGIKGTSDDIAAFFAALAAGA